MSIYCIIKADTLLITDTLLIPYIVKSYRSCILLLALHVSLRFKVLRICQISRLCIVRTDNLLLQFLLKCCRHRYLLLSLFKPPPQDAIEMLYEFKKYELGSVA